MERITFTSVVLLLVFGLHQRVTARKPKMTPAVEELYIQEGDELRIECEGERKLQFSTQTLNGIDRQSDFMPSFDENSGTYTLIRHSATGIDTGWYACAEEGIVISNDEQTIDHPNEEISWIYVYVNSSTPFAVMTADYEVIPSIMGSKVIIPCRPTSPQLPVILEINWNDKTVPEGTLYDPKIGFVINNVGLVDNGAICRCKLNSTDEDISIDWPSYALYVADPKPLEKPWINKDTLQHVVEGTDVTLECVIRVPTGTIFHMNWTAPESVPQERLHYTKHPVKLRDNIGGRDTWKTELIVKSAEESDGGEYICTAKGLDADNVAYTSTKIKIWDPSYTYINVSLDYESASVSIYEKETVKWNIKIDTYPEEFKWEWYMPDGTLIEDISANERSKYSHVKRGRIHVFRISHLTIHDNGNYTIRISTEKDEQTIILPLTVVVPPFARIDNTLSYYAPGQSAIFSCYTFGSPLPNVTWIYIEYPDYPHKENFRRKFPSNIHDVMVDEDSSRLESQLNVIINMTGEVICKSCNIIDCTETSEPVIVSDGAGLFGIVGPELVTEGDSINLTCAVSIYDYTDTINWILVDFENQIHNVSSMLVTKRRTKFTSQSILQIHDVKKSDSGLYWCEAISKTGHSKTTLWKLSVQDARTPVITETNYPHKSKIILTQGRDENNTMTLECWAEASPTPEVNWYKDNKLLAENDHYRFARKNSVLHIKNIHEDHGGRYSCQAKNRIGKAERYIDVVIERDSHTLFKLYFVILSQILKTYQKAVSLW